MAKIERFEDLEIWQLARELANELYLEYSEGIFNKDFELKGQMNGSSGSVMDNIAEGFERGGNKEFINFLIIAKGSAGELRSQIYRAFDRTYFSQDKFAKYKSKVEIISKKISSLIITLRNSDMKGYYRMK
ncbi:MAG: four helix bundle protein [Spirosomaceae bacterium]|jgi:four helix bundle protein|nr:four helix bundle protein [Spirosomataceae bacterium]